MTRRDDLLEQLDRAAREIERDVEQLRSSAPARNGDRPSIEKLRVTAAELATSSVELARLEAESQHAAQDDDALLEQIQARFDNLPRKGSVVDELIAERRVEAWREELESYDR